MQVLDSDGDGTVDYHEFVKFVTQDHEQQLKVCWLLRRSAEASVVQRLVSCTFTPRLFACR